MTVQQLISALEKCPPNMDVFMAERKTEFSYGLVNSAYVKEINFVEEPFGEILARDKVIVLDEE